MLPAQKSDRGLRKRIADARDRTKIHQSKLKGKEQRPLGEELVHPLPAVFAAFERHTGRSQRDGQAISDPQNNLRSESPATKAQLT